MPVDASGKLKGGIHALMSFGLGFIFRTSHLAQVGCGSMCLQFQALKEAFGPNDLVLLRNLRPGQVPFHKQGLDRLCREH